MRNRAVRVVGPAAWIGWPALIAVIATLLLATPVRVFSMPLPEPVFPMVLAFAWPLIRPSLLAPVALFATGLFLDLLWGTPAGLWPLSLLAVYGVILFARSLIMGQDTVMLFGWWSGAVVGAFLIAYTIVATDSGAAPTLWGVLLQVIATILLFPFANDMVTRFDDGDVRFR